MLVDTSYHHDISLFAEELSGELERILDYWSRVTVDEVQGGFIGLVDADNQRQSAADKGLVLNSRILWSFSAAASVLGNTAHRQLAARAFHYIRDYFMDVKYGGAYWSVDATGRKKEGRKQTYGIAFCIYGLSEYVKLTGDETALGLAIQLYLSLQSMALDKTEKGYTEAFDEEWKPTEDLRLSPKDINTPKTTNTHLHVLEAFANLYPVWPDERLRNSIRSLLRLFKEHMIDAEGNHLKLFFTRDWKPVGDLCSPGHDIEAAWLLQQCAAVLNEQEYTRYFRERAIAMSAASLAYLDKDGALNYEADPVTGTLNREKHWWVQAEAMVGFYNAFQLTAAAEYLEAVKNIWQFIKNHLLDSTHGEWYWGVTENHIRMRQSKAGFWKCPYHNTRACMELIKRMEASIG